ncbi:unnamed protein product, partial [marine sediment metagenome]
KLQLIGSDPELIGQNRECDSSRGYEKPVGVNAALNPFSLGYVEFHGIDNFAAATVPNLDYQPLGWYVKFHGGEVPDATAPLAIPGKEYRLRVRMKAETPLEDAMDVSVKVLGENLSHVVMDKTTVLGNVDLTADYRWYGGNFRVPDNQEAWIIKTIWDSKQPGGMCYLDEWSVTRADNTGTETEDFWVEINGENCFCPGVMSEGESCLFDLQPPTIKNDLHFNVGVEGCRTGAIRMVYENPILWSDDVSIGVNSVGDNVYNCRFEMVSRYAPDNVSLSPLGDRVDIEDATCV